MGGYGWGGRLLRRLDQQPLEPHISYLSHPTRPPPSWAPAERLRDFAAPQGIRVRRRHSPPRPFARSLSHWVDTAQPGAKRGDERPRFSQCVGAGAVTWGPVMHFFVHPRPDVAGATNTTKATARAENRVVRPSSSLPHVSRDDLHLCGARNDSWSLYPLTNFQLQKISSMTGAHISSPTQCCNWLHSSPPHHPELYSLNTCFSVHSCSVVVMLELI